MTCVSALSTFRNTETAIAEVLGKVAAVFADSPAGLAFVFVSEHHADSLGAVSARLRDQGLARHVIGCTGESILAEDREVEGSPALAVLAVDMPEADVSLHRLAFRGQDFQGWSPGAAGGGPAKTSLFLLGDPFSFPVDPFLKAVGESVPGLRVIGGMASGSQAPGGNRLVLDGEVFEDGAVAAAFSSGVTLRTVVSQGCRPIGRAMVVTKVEKNVIRELGRRPAVEVFKETFETLPDEEQDLVRGGLHIGRVINEYQESFQRGDFLVRNVLGADDQGGLAVTDVIRVGQTVQFHVRDAETADEDLRSMLETVKAGAARGALVFTCNGRGSRLFAEPSHDLTVLHDVLGPVPAAGFFAMGEIGPVGGQNFVHGFTASIVLFEDPTPA